MAFSWSPLLLRWMWAAGQTPGIEVVGLTCQGSVCSKYVPPQRLPTDMKALSKLWPLGAGTADDAVGVPAGGPIRLLMRGRFPFQIEMPPEIQRALKAPRAKAGVRRPYPTNRVVRPTDVTRQINALRVANAKPELPCSFMAVNVMNDSDGSTSGAIEIINPKCVPRIAGEDPFVPKAQTDTTLGPREKAFLVALREMGAGPGGRFVTIAQVASHIGVREKAPVYSRLLAGRRNNRSAGNYGRASQHVGCRDLGLTEKEEGGRGKCRLTAKGDAMAQAIVDQ